MSGPRRVRLSHVERLLGALSPRDISISETLARVPIATGVQLERLHFYDLGSRSRSVKRWQVLRRLVEARVLLPVERRVGTSIHGSDKLSYMLDSAGLHVLRLRAQAAAPDTTVRRPRVPGERFVNHMLAITELYVLLTELGRLGVCTVRAFDVEPRWPNGVGGWLGPDAYVQLVHDRQHYSWWFEADLGSESLPTLEKKLAAYLSFVERGQFGPDGIVPWVLIGVSTEARRGAVQRIVNGFNELAGYLFRVSLLPDCVTAMAQEFIS